ncbi:winged helix-turn-helix transcriptional regulator [Streptomyces oryzae]|uniref:Winged helix-turn-helix transcriptional regulator n=1 Tax=Streptomyces oryzae TaxID=1434886 RepID=A0ABS3X418_9ACTN|nr:MarR family winged helix-turn-helix transcriptional regulator [Streptomyces oryzae]MBO8190121.1 winged helix-turn-helix transcriptional regulator [Streptomyces oryzae]
MESNPPRQSVQSGEVAAIERAVVALRRQQRSHALARLSARRGMRQGRYGALPDAVFQLLDAVDAAAERGHAPTVTEAATALAVDQPRASRLAAQALDAGLLHREADQSDGRRSLLRLTPDGRAALDRIRTLRRQVIAEALTHWPPEDRAALARLLARFVSDVTAITDR